MCLEILCGVDWFHLVKDGLQLWALVNTVLNLRVP
jgi:hypothetical protein